MKILVIRFSSMGDVILATPLFTWLRTAFPAASIAFVTDDAYAGLFADDPRLEKVVNVNSESLRNTAWDKIIATKWDIIIDLQNNARSRLLVRQLRTASTVDVFDKLHGKRLALLLLRRSGFDPDAYVAARYIKAAAEGLEQKQPAVPGVSLFFNEAARAKAMASFNRLTGVNPSAPSLAFFPFSAWKNKEWPAENFTETGRRFIDKGWNVAIMAGPAEMGQAEQMREAIGESCVSFAGTRSLYEIGCLLTGFKLALGNDTGLSHLARACGVRTGIIYGPTTRHFGFFPYGEPPFAVFEEQLLCRPCHAHGGNLCLRWLSRRCMRQISVTRVIEGLEALVRKR